MTGGTERVYSNALFELSAETDCIEKTYEELSFVSGAFEQNPELSKILSVPTITFEEKQRLVTEVFGNRISELSLNFLKVLVYNGKASLIPKIFSEYKASYYLKNGIIEIKATTAVRLSGELKDRLVKKLESISSKKVILIEEQDASIIGGIVISYGNTQIDSSIKSKIDSMRKQINSIIA